MIFDSPIFHFKCQQYVVSSTLSNMICMTNMYQQITIFAKACRFRVGHVLDFNIVLMVSVHFYFCVCVIQCLGGQCHPHQRRLLSVFGISGYTVCSGVALVRQGVGMKNGVPKHCCLRRHL
jgi:hypothetical protein